MAFICERTGERCWVLYYVREWKMWVGPKAWDLYIKGK